MTDTKFWEIIKELDWDGNPSHCTYILLNKIENKEIESPQAFYNYIKSKRKPLDLAMGMNFGK